LNGSFTFASPGTEKTATLTSALFDQLRGAAIPPQTSLKLQINYNHLSVFLFYFSTNNSAHAFDALRDNREREFFEVFVHEWSRHATQNSVCTLRSLI
jgi:hypothetical protein